MDKKVLLNMRYILKWLKSFLELHAIGSCIKWTHKENIRCCCPCRCVALRQVDMVSWNPVNHLKWQGGERHTHTENSPGSCTYISEAPSYLFFSHFIPALYKNKSWVLYSIKLKITDYTKSWNYTLKMTEFEFPDTCKCGLESKVEFERSRKSPGY